MSERMLNRQEAATHLGISEGTLAELRRRGSLPAIKIGRVFRYRTADLDTYLRANSINPPEAEPPQVTEESPLELISLAVLHELRRHSHMLAQLTRRLP